MKGYLELLKYTVTPTLLNIGSGLNGDKLVKTVLRLTQKYLEIFYESRHKSVLSFVL